jgi:hypothetical protein
MDTNLLVVLGFIVFAIILYLYYKRSKFGENCTIDNREYPSGHLPGSDIILTETEKKNLLMNFINNGDQTIE